MTEERLQLGDLLNSRIMGRKFEGDGFSVIFHKDNFVLEDNNTKKEFILDYCTKED